MEGASGTESQKVENIEDFSTIYRKHPLSASTTRVLHILPATKPDQSDIISCRLRVISLNPSPPEYRALSYVWGNPSVTRIILVDGQEFEVRINLWNYLLQARKEGYMDPLWVDAVCIDQTNLAERNVQVALMGQIYSKAMEVRAWLGLGTKRNLEAMQLLEEVDWQGQAIQMKSGNFFGLARAQIETICEILDLQYWSRLWILQEYILGSCVSVQCGFKVVSGTTLKCMADAVIRQPYSNNEFPTLIHTTAYGTINARASHTRYNLSSAGYRFTILLFSSLKIWHSKCTDLHDHVYALLSLDKIASEEIVPDYTKSLAQLFLEIIHFFKTKHVLAHKHLLNLGYGRIAVKELQKRWKLSDCAEACQAYHEFEEHICRLEERKRSESRLYP